MITAADIDVLKEVYQEVKKQGIVYKHLCGTDTLIYLHCLTELGLLRQSRDTAHIYWEITK